MFLSAIIASIGVLVNDILLFKMSQGLAPFSNLFWLLHLIRLKEQVISRRFLIFLIVYLTIGVIGLLLSKTVFFLGYFSIFLLCFSAWGRCHMEFMHIRL